MFATFKTNCFTPINLMAGTCQEYSFFIFASCEPLRKHNNTPSTHRTFSHESKDILWQLKYNVNVDIRILCDSKTVK